MPLPIVGINYEQTSTLDWTERVTCRRCGQAATARIATTGTGRGKAIYGLGREAAKDRAGLSAFDQAVELARDLIQLARCPRCERRYGGLYWLGFKVTFAWTLIAGPIHGMVWVVLSQSDASTSSMRVAGTLVWGTAIALAVYSFKRKLKTVDDGVRLERVHLEAVEAPHPPREQALPDFSRDRSLSEESAGATSDSGLELDLDRSWNRGK